MQLEPIRNIHAYWFGDMDDATPLDREREPFTTHFTRWYGKDPAVDDAIRDRFEPLLLEISESGRRFEPVTDAGAAHPKGLLALTLLLDQLPRNMYRSSAHMHRWELGLIVSERARTTSDDYTLIEEMFLAVPLMHAECPTLQHRMLTHFERLVSAAEARSPHNVGFFRFALDYAQRHVDVVDRFGRFPHRNAILGRRSTGEELGFLFTDAAYF